MIRKFLAHYVLRIAILHCYCFVYLYCCEIVVRSGGAKMDGGSNRIGDRADQLVTNAVAAKTDTPAAATASKPG
ncbi:hypothetical protein QVD17_33160 [Tagetes erecta]|uniref:Uncharacterized protein n=1 Tax=Tagetes erecta TaxID=13708 RepID=A0AAD8JWH5_TARER|nr:hypothetical protein QVD17_33160 [Tagetes erecta]